MQHSPILIAEVKVSSPFGFKSAQSWNQLFDLACAHGDMISIHTDARWGGSINDIAKARNNTSKPILAKGIHSTDTEIKAVLGAGADAVLVVGRLPSKKLLPFCLIEPTSLKQFAEFIHRAPKNQRFVWNSRDLRDGSIKTEVFSEARKLWDGWLCQASNIRTLRDIEPSANAILVGQNLQEFTTNLQSTIEVEPV